MLFNFELGNQVYAKARVKPTTKAHLWLGADVMLEYPLDEAIELLVSAGCKHVASMISPCRCTFARTLDPLSGCRLFAWHWQPRSAGGAAPAWWLLHDGIEAHWETHGADNPNRDTCRAVTQSGVRAEE